jgi:hypothetical protein
MDISLEWHQDFAPDATGDLLTVDGDDETRQRLERRLFTAVQGYVWHPDYGAGLPQKIGSVYTLNQIKAIVMQQIAQEASVAANPPAIVTITQINDQIMIGIQYWDAVTGVTVSFTITA